MTDFTWVQFNAPLFQLNVPSTWIAQATPEIQAMFSEPETDQALVSNLIILVRVVDSGVSPASIVDEAQPDMAREFEAYELLSREDFENGDVQGVTISFRWHDSASGLDVLQLQVYFVYEDWLFSLLATTEEAHADALRPVFYEMIGSFTMRIPEPTAKNQ